MMPKNKKIKKWIIQSLIFAFIIIFIGLAKLCYLNIRDERENAARQRHELILKGSYIDSMGFHNNRGIVGLPWFYFESNPNATLTLVSTREEIINFPDDVVVAFPTILTLIQLNILNYYLASSHYMACTEIWYTWHKIAIVNGLEMFFTFEAWERASNRLINIDLNDFMLSFPVTMDDVVYNWKNVSDLFIAIPVTLSGDMRTLGMTIHRVLIENELAILNSAIESLGFEVLEFEFPITMANKNNNADAIRAFYETYLEGTINIPIFIEHLTWWREFE